MSILNTMQRWVGLTSSPLKVNTRAGMIGVTLASLCLTLPAGAASLPEGSRITPSYNCTYPFGQTLDGTKTGNLGVESSGMYSFISTPNLPGGHWEIHGRYPRTALVSMQGFNQFLAVDGFINGKDIAPDPGSVNPWLPGNSFVEGHDYYTLRLSFAPPELSPKAQPPGVMYVGWRNGWQASKLGILQTIEGSPTSYGSVPLPTATWVVDDPAKNIVQNERQLCYHMYWNSQPYQWAFALSTMIDNPAFEKAQTNYLYRQYLPLFLDPFSGRNNHIHVNVARPSPKGYSFPGAANSADYISIAPNPKYGKFYVVRFKAPSYSRAAYGIPNTGQEQVGYWVWCGVQVYSILVNTTSCVTAEQAHPDKDGYVTLVISPKDERPVINGKPYPDWIQNPAAGGLLWGEEFGPDPINFPQSPYFAPPSMTIAPGIPILNDIIYWNKEKQLKQHMGEYFPQAFFCTKEKFEQGDCKPPAN